MSELREWTASEIEEYDDARLELSEDGKVSCTKLYIKSEADKVIEELKEKYKTEVKELLYLIRDKDNNFNRAFDSEEKELRHHKYKRCLAMTERCLTEKVYWHYRYNDYGDKGYTREYKWRKVELWRKWAMRWLKIAEKFKEGDKCRG